MRRGKTWSNIGGHDNRWFAPELLSGRSDFNGYLFYERIITRLVPTLRGRHPGGTMAIALDKCSIHCSYEARPAQALLDAGFLFQFIPSYSPDYNPIRLTFHVLKSWIRRHHMCMRPPYQMRGEFMSRGIEASGCCRHARALFRYAAGELYVGRRRASTNKGGFANDVDW